MWAKSNTSVSHQFAISVQSLHFIIRDVRPREVKDVSKAGLGGPGAQISWIKCAGLFLLYWVMIPDLHRSVSPLWRKLVEDTWPNQEWLLLYFSHPNHFLFAMATACEAKGGEGRHRQWGQEHMPFNSFLATFLSSPPLTLPSHHPLYGAKIGLVECDWSGNPLIARGMSVHGGTFPELSAQPVQKLWKKKSNCQKTQEQ